MARISVSRYHAGVAGRYRGNGEGTISKRKDGRWVARYHVHTTDGLKRKALYAGSRSEAATKLAKAIADRDGKGLLSAEPTKLTVAGYMGDWLAHKKTEVAPQSFRNHEQVNREWIEPAIGSLRLLDLRRAHVETLKTRMAEEGLAPTTVSRVLATLSAAMNRAVDWELIPANPTATVRRPKDRRQAMRALSEEEASRLMSVASGTRRETLYALATKLGPRQGELRGLRWQDVDLDGAALKIERSVSTTNGVVWGPTKTGEPRTVRLSPGLVATLRRHRLAQLEERTARRGACLGRPQPRLPERPRRGLAPPAHAPGLQARPRGGGPSEDDPVP